MDWNSLELPTHLQSDPVWHSLCIPLDQADEAPGLIAPLDDINLQEILEILPPYAYEPLNPNRREIRLLYLHGGATLTATNADGVRETLLQATLKHVSLSPPDSSTPPPQFAALSYCWGDPSRTQPILVDGCVIHITESLHSALVRLSGAEYVLPLWVDAVCINQRDVREKENQVPMMGDIYRTAELVVGWLGPASEGSDLAMKALGYIGQEMCAMDDGPVLEERAAFFAQVLPVPSDDERVTAKTQFPAAAVGELLERPWWLRTWVVQEVVLAQRDVYVLCGRAEVPFVQLAMGYSALVELLPMEGRCSISLLNRLPQLRPLFTCRQPRLQEAFIRCKSIGPMKLHQILTMVPTMGASDKRDHIFGLLGMVTDAEKLGIKPLYGDYQYATLFQEVTKALLMKEGHLQLLVRCGLSRENNLPSWVPDWSITKVSLAPIWSPTYRLYKAGIIPIVPNLARFAGLHFANPKMSEGGEQLAIYGKVFSPVKQLGFAYASENRPQEYPMKEDGYLNKCLETMESFAREHCPATSRTARELNSALWRTPITDKELVFTQAGRLMRRISEASAQAGYESIRQVGLTSDTSYAMLADSMLAGRRLFVTESGHLGIGPMNLQPGDLICVLIQAEVPFALRSKRIVNRKRLFWEPEQIHAELVGECYVHGIMDGECLAQWPPKLEEFLLS